ncbi:caveolin-1-like [Sycon ciliatum]|uniref:caveolin-1-like n=1 Tax=Sycon ciliatum TaxID=27933 RepID=UPI0020A88EE8|eukprot:scpid92563/ scgid11725/ Caveolin-1
MATSGSGTYEPIQTYQEYQDTDRGASSQASSSGGGPSASAPPARPNAVLEVAIPGENEAGKIAEYMRVVGKEIFVEADGVRSLPQVYEIAVTVYDQVKAWTYIILTTLFAVLMAIIWGLMLAFISFFMIWWVNPAIRIFYIMVRSFAKLWSTSVQAFFDPLYYSFALIFSRAKVGVSMRKGAVQEV